VTGTILSVLMSVVVVVTFAAICAGNAKNWGTMEKHRDDE
jgi:hypothetical protein